MGFLDKLFGRKPEPAAPTAEEIVARDAKRLDNAIWAARDAMQTSFIPQILAKYRAGSPAFDHTNLDGERQRIGNAAEQVVLEGFRKAYPEGNAAYDDIREETVEAVIKGAAG